MQSKLTAGPSTSELVQETEDEPMDDPEDTEGTGPAAEMDSDHEENWNWGGGGDFVFDETPRASALRTQRRPRRLMRRRHRLRLGGWEERDLLRGAGIQGRRRWGKDGD
mmetsp:Transcript_1252/g.3978  ORF Transcript_1252/g.3978 Transcript_1252/m.3978 type:complete len:109 (+) Transcript_1252:376-702(+)